LRCTSLYQALAHLEARNDSSTVVADIVRRTAAICRCNA
jgi:hypothetical protein